MKKLLLIFSIICAPIGYACMNEYEPIIGIDRNEDKPDGYIATLYLDNFQLYSYIAANLYKFDQLDKEASDVAIAYVYVKNYKRALQITSKLIGKYPSEYNVNITHAVCLELNGQPEKALPFLKKAVEINPDSHWGSEWIHIRILEWVISKQDVQGKSVLGLNFGDDGIPQLEDDSIDVKKTLEHLEYQLEDRAFFADSNDIIYGSMLYDFANLLYLSGEELSSQRYFENAKEYGFKHPALEKRIEQVKKIRDDSAEKRNQDNAKKVHQGPSDYDPIISNKNLALLILSIGAALLPAILFIRQLFKKKNV